LCDNGEKNQKGGRDRQVRNPLRFIHQKDRQEIRAPAKSQVRLPRLRQGNSSLIQSQVRRSASGIWHCKGCKVTFAGGAFEFATSVATTAKVTMTRLKKLKEELNNNTKEEEEKKETKEVKREKKAKAPKAPKA